MTDDEFVKQASAEISEIEEPPKSLEEFVTIVQEEPEIAAPAAKYVLNAIESCGKRTVTEMGEEKERWRFFDDPYGNGEHAVLGNTDILNSFVDELRSIASGEASEKILWFGGPTATGKSELKRCFINGLRGYSRTDEGRRYTIEWNPSKRTEVATGMTYGEGVENEGEWYRSPVNSNPLSVFPRNTRDSITEELDYDIDVDLDPFSREAFNILKEECRDSGEEDIFESVVSEDNLRVVRNALEIGDGIGVLHSEDGGEAKERLVGAWMPNMFREYSSRGRKNPQAFSFDGVISQGNGGLSIIEDAGRNADLLPKLLNIPEESMVKLDKKLTMDVDTVLIVISNPDLEAQLEKYSDEIGDPNRAIRRRLDKYEFQYLTSLTTETNLIRRELGVSNDVDEDENIREPEVLNATEFAPHTLESAAMYDIVSRIEREGVLSLLDKALAFDRGYHVENGEKIDIEQFDIHSESDGEEGIPVTYTQDILVDLSQSDKEIIIPPDAIDALQENLHDDALFSYNEADWFSNRSVEVKEYACNRMEEDVLDAMLRDKGPTEGEVEEYVDGIFAWEENNGEESDEYDKYRLKEFEKEHFSAEDEGYEDDGSAGHEVEAFRREQIINPINSYLWESDEEEDEVRASPTLERILDDKSWSMVVREYPDFKPEQWESPPSNTETEELKEKTIENMVDMFDYSEASAEKTSYYVIENRNVVFGGNGD